MSEQTDDAPAWMAELSPDTRAALAPKRYANVDELGKAYIAAERAVGADKLVLPGKDAKPEDWNGVYDRLGRPAKPEAYELTAPPEVAIDAGLEKGFRETAHKLGLNGGQAGALFAWYGGLISEALASADADAERTNATLDASLKKDWGGAYAAKKDLAQRAFALVFGDGAGVATLKLEGGMPLAAHPAFVKAFAKLGEELSEDGELPNARGGRLTKTPQEARAEIARLKADKGFQEKFLDRRHPEHASAQALMESLLAAQGDMAA